MFYVQRDAEGQLLRVEAAPYEHFTEMLPADHAEIQAWFADDVVENSLRQLKQSDLDMIRVLEDLIDVLTTKGVISITDLPVGAQSKLLNRSTARKALGSLNNLIEEDDNSGLI
ncbi:tryptophan synthase subunit beta [Pseudomonas sp. PSKL.D1]|uniref:tryptophan synthase subunit beta n=1 Tax=Pseudomonas sp. PSKL.D1 TaxID=3029060 RepID=UPI002380E905|nr:tryptophan synthase subunit beta [Pseudomonas sp. PSKL.D1]WDY60533.1 tryptophan synthase subunit beta [Pseudomonas sp. PSKL.D1]